jgi:L-2-hydroxyglutarate oxidase LhgO
MAGMFVANPAFRSLALREPRKYLPRFFYKDARELVKELRPGEIRSCDKVGIRNQLIDRNKLTLIMDFLSARDEHSFHVLNAVSPGFTSSMSLARFLSDELAANFSL